MLVDAGGELLGQLPAFDVATPWWQDVEPIVAARPDVVVLRLLHASPDPHHVMGGEVTYVAEVDRVPQGTRPFDGDAASLADDPLRMPWARPGGPAADLTWAARHVEIVGRPVQVRSWNLSSIWRLPTADGPVWLKCVPPFFAHEPDVLRLLGSHPSVPVLLAAGDGRMLLADMAGRDGYEASVDARRDIVDIVVSLQLEASSRLPELERLVPDWRPRPLRSMVHDLVAPRHAPAFRGLLDGWDDRFDEIASCGLPDTLFHGDAHAGNARVGVDAPIVFDWGDSGVGHPLLDLSVVYETEASAAELRRHWLARWADAVPGSAPGRAWALLRPVALLRMAVVFQRFLDNIEPSERIYHAGDVEPFLRRAHGALHEPEAE